jgi:hypothetical protein
MIVLQSSNLQKVSRWNLLVHCSPTKKFHLGLSICLPKLAGVEWGMGALELDGVGQSRRKFATRSQSDSGSYRLQWKDGSKVPNSGNIDQL